MKDSWHVIDWEVNMMTIVSVLIGGLLSLMGSFFAVRLEHKRALDERRYKYKVNQLIQPVTSFVDECLKLIEGTYWNATDLLDEGRRWDAETVPPTMHIERFREFREKEGIINARLEALNDPDMGIRLAQLTGTFLQFRSHITACQISKAFDAMKEARKLAGEIYRRINQQV